MSAATAIRRADSGSATLSRTAKNGLDEKSVSTTIRMLCTFVLVWGIATDVLCCEAEAMELLRKAIGRVLPVLLRTVVFLAFSHCWKRSRPLLGAKKSCDIREKSHTAVLVECLVCLESAGSRCLMACGGVQRS